MLQSIYFALFNLLALASLPLLLGPLLVSAQQNPTISFITKERVTSIGDTLDISCSVQYAKNYPVIWAKIDTQNPSNILFISKGASLSIPDNRYSIRHDDASSTYTLQISKIQEIDAGQYQCQVVTSSSSRVTASVLVYVRIPPIINDNSTRSMITSTGESIQLECYAFGYPQPAISWRRENNNLLPTGGSQYKGNILIIHNITRADRGTYYCIADNNVGSGARRNVMVEVEFAPIIREDETRYAQAIRHESDLHCRVDSYPAATIQWFKDGSEVQDSTNYQISLLSSSNGESHSVLRVRHIERRHFGLYTCRATNKLGTAHKQIELYESPNPVCPPACERNYAGFSSYAHTTTTLSPGLLSLWLILTLFWFRSLPSLSFLL